MGYNKVFVAGGGSGVGRAVVDELVKQGSQVVALVRREDAKTELEAIDGGWEMSSVAEYLQIILCLAFYRHCVQLDVLVEALKP